MSYNIDPEFSPFLEMLQEVPSLSDVTAARAYMDGLSELDSGIDTPGLRIEDRWVDGPAGAEQIRVRIYSPEATVTNLPAILYIHGGGFVTGSLDTEHASAVQLAGKLGVVVVSVDYRLAPENPYPAGLEDCYAALVWLHESAAELNVDTARIAVFGQSAGGGLSAALALLARDRGGPALCFQFLGIPELDDRLETPSMRAFVDTPLWQRPNAVLSWKYYLGEQYQSGGADVPFYAAPARATDLRGLPPAYISAMEFDPLRDEAIHYALKLLEAGVQVELHAYPGTFHGSSLVTQATISQRQEREMFDVLRRAFKL